MNTHRRALALRRESLVAQSEAQRRNLATLSQPLAKRLAWFDDGLTLGRWVRGHPGWLAAAALGLALWRPAKALRLAGLALTLWRATSFLRAAERR
jgi:hypothetical protein